MADRPHALLSSATSRLARGGVESAEYDARVLLAHVLRVPGSRLALVEEVSPEQGLEYAALVTRRAAREPLQHLTGTTGFRHVELRVGPGVFLPRPETELLAGWAVEQAREVLRRRGRAVVADLCTGSGAIARALVDEVPLAEVHAVELDETAYAYAQDNLAGTGVDLRCGDLSTALGDLAGSVDVIACNPPYIPLEAWESVTPEVRDHDPHLALFSGADGLDAIRSLEIAAAALLRVGGVLGVEHAEVQARSAPAVFTSAGRWVDVRDHHDLAGRPRLTTVRLAR